MSKKPLFLSLGILLSGVSVFAQNTYYRDADQDGYGNPTMTVSAASAPEGYVSVSGDCNDDNVAVHMGAPEVCDGLDNDCDGAVDEAGTTMFYRDADGDGYGNIYPTFTGCYAPAGYVDNSSDCNDSDNTIHPGAVEIPDDGIDQNCDNSIACFEDADNDGYRTNSTITSADCDCLDGGEALPSDPAGDCNDHNAAIHPGISEACDGLDNDCDGMVDEGAFTIFYRDADGDGHGNAYVTVVACPAPAGYVSNSDDCNDSDNTIYPGAAEIPGDEIDQNCDGAETCYADADNDGYRTSSTISSVDCDCIDDGEAKASEPTGDCDDGDAAINPGAEEICDGKDNNCDGISFQDTENTITENACNSYTAPDGTVYTTTGVKTAVIPNAAGCDSLITIDLTINSIDIAVTQSSNILTALASPASYKWLDCGNNNSPITNESDQTFTADVSGDYAVAIMQNDCVDTSMCYTVSIISTIENTFDENLVVYPNPTNGFFSIDLGANLQKIEIDVKDMSGRIIKKSRFRNRQFLDFELDEPAGIYFVTIISENKIAIIKLVKK